MGPTSSAQPSSGALTLREKIKWRRKAVATVKAIQPCWPDPEKSVGTFYGTIDDEKYWRLKDSQCPAYYAFQILVSDLDTILHTHTEPSLTPVLWKIYMIGDSTSLCAPGIILCCADAKYRELASSKISESRTLEKFPGVLIRYQSGPPKSRGPLVAMTSPSVRSNRQDQNSSLASQQGESSAIQGPRGSPLPSPVEGLILYGRHDIRDDHMSTTEIQYLPDPNLAAKSLGYIPLCLGASVDIRPGCAVQVWMEKGGRQTATIGGTIRICGFSCLMTAAHSFVDDEPDGSMNRRESSTHNSNFVSIGGLLYSSVLDDHPELDYVLILPSESLSFTDEEDFAFPKFTLKQEMMGLNHTLVTSVTASAGQVNGQIETIPDLVRLPRSKRLQVVYTVEFERSLAKGDSGSWVIAKKNDSLHGHIVAGVPEDGLAIIVPAYQVFQDLARVFDVEQLRAQLRVTEDPHAWLSVNSELFGAIENPAFGHGSPHFAHSTSSSEQRSSRMPSLQLTGPILDKYDSFHPSTSVINMWIEAPRRDDFWDGMDIRYN